MGAICSVYVGPMVIKVKGMKILDGPTGSVNSNSVTVSTPTS